MLLYSILKGFCLNVYICIGQDIKTGERKTWVVEVRKQVNMDNQSEVQPTPVIEDQDSVLKNEFKVEKEKRKMEREYQATQKKVCGPTDSVFSENFNYSILLRPTIINWAHAFEKPIAENGKEMQDYQIDCLFNESEFHLNLQDQRMFTWDNFNQNISTNPDWLQVDRD